MRALTNLLALALVSCLILAIGVTGLAQPTPVPSDGDMAALEAQPASPEVNKIVEMVMHQNPDLRSYQARAHVTVQPLVFPWVPFGLEGKVYYNSPGYTVYDFPHTPSFLQGITKAEGAVGIVSRWRHCYAIALENRPDDYILHMVPKIYGEVSEMTVTVNKTSGNLEHFHWSYHSNPNDGVDLAQTYGDVNGHEVVIGQKSEIARHYVRAKITGYIDGFQYNVAVPTPTPTPSDPYHQCDN